MIKTAYATFKTIKADNALVGYYLTDGVNYVLYAGDTNIYYSIVKPGADKTDFDNNHKASYTSVAAEAIAIASIKSGLFRMFTNEALADGVYEDSIVAGCDFVSKTFTLENKHATNGLKYKIWGSANNTDYEEIKTETALAALIKTTVVNNDMWKFVKVSAKGDGGASTIDSYLQVGQ